MTNPNMVTRQYRNKKETIEVRTFDNWGEAINFSDNIIKSGFVTKVTRYRTGGYNFSYKVTIYNKKA